MIYFLFISYYLLCHGKCGGETLYQTRYCWIPLLGVFATRPNSQDWKNKDFERRLSIKKIKNKKIAHHKTHVACPREEISNPHSKLHQKIVHCFAPILFHLLALLACRMNEYYWPSLESWQVMTFSLKLRWNSNQWTPVWVYFIFQGRPMLCCESKIKLH